MFVVSGVFWLSQVELLMASAANTAVPYHFEPPSYLGWPVVYQGFIQSPSGSRLEYRCTLGLALSPSLGSRVVSSGLLNSRTRSCSFLPRATEEDNTRKKERVFSLFTGIRTHEFPPTGTAYCAHTKNVTCAGGREHHTIRQTCFILKAMITLMLY